MFTGIIEAAVSVISLQRKGAERVLTIENPFGNELKEGDSIAVDGVCLTVTSFDDKKIDFFMSEATVKKTIADRYVTGSLVNCERAMQMGGRLDGHIVQGHVDTVATVRSVRRVGDGVELVVEVPDTYAGLVVDRGSIALNGISLTLAELDGNRFTLSLIPESLSRTNLRSFLREGGRMNAEFDILGKYVQRQMQIAEKTDYATLLEKL